MDGEFWTGLTDPSLVFNRGFLFQKIFWQELINCSNLLPIYIFLYLSICLFVYLPTCLNVYLSYLQILEPPELLAGYPNNLPKYQTFRNHYPNILDSSFFPLDERFLGTVWKKCCLVRFLGIYKRFLSGILGPNLKTWLPSQVCCQRTLVNWTNMLFFSPYPFQGSLVTKALKRLLPW